MTELREIIKLAGHNRKLKDSRNALEAAGAMIHPTDAELADETFSPLEEHGATQTGDQVLPTINPNSDLVSIANETEIIGQQPISVRETSGWNRILRDKFMQRLRRKQNAA